MADNGYVDLDVKPFPRDKNSKKLYGTGTDVITKRWASVDSSTGQAISMPDDCKAVAIHVEGSTVVATYTGNSGNSATVNITSDGYWLPGLPIVAEADGTFGTIKAPSGTIAVSAWGFR
jgi:hypothetical protein